MPLRAVRSLLFVLLLSACAGPAAQVDQTASPIDPVLQASIYEYLDTPDTERADQLLAMILGRQDATPASVSTIFAADRSYRAEPVGVLPSRELRLGGRAFYYGLYVPDSYRPGKAYGLVICLHGAGFTGDTYLERWQTRLGEGYLLACPTLPMGNWWTRTAEDLVLATIRAVEARYHVDPNRVFLTGMSNGGIGAYLIGAHHASRFAAVIPMAAGLDDILLPFLENFRQTPLYIIHGRQDQVMPVSLSRAIDEALTTLGYLHVYREHDRVHPMAGGHFFPREELPDLIAWLADRHRNPYPKKLTVVRDASHLLPFNWVRIDATDRIAEFSENLIDRRDEAIATKRYARLEAEVVGPNKIEVRTQRIRRYTLYLNQNLVDLSRPVTIMTNGVITYEGLVVPSTKTLLREARARQDHGVFFSASVSVAVPSSK
ncbi:MAG TPA: prolyl oligopeptidase family serine peptidase [Nitrospirales bacterium]|jgi:pimeloyl-ACP methyl ester carboxylesterase|nr:prolyl oligopeptidase family serine peptidase [Nitrospirales bacterium]